jgi:hypothetical protein
MGLKCLHICCSDHLQNRLRKQTNFILRKKKTVPDFLKDMGSFILYKLAKIKKKENIIKYS